MSTRGKTTTAPGRERPERVSPSGTSASRMPISAQEAAQADAALDARYHTGGLDAEDNEGTHVSMRSALSTAIAKGVIAEAQFKSPEQRTAAIDFARRHINDTHESGNAIDESGHLLFANGLTMAPEDVRGISMQVEYDEAQTARMMSGGDHVSGIHNHPEVQPLYEGSRSWMPSAGVPPSHGDFADMVAHHSTSQIIAAPLGNGAAIYTVTKTTPDWPASPRAVANYFQNARDFYSERMSDDLAVLRASAKTAERFGFSLGVEIVPNLRGAGA